MMAADFSMTAIRLANPGKIITTFPNFIFEYRNKAWASVILRAKPEEACQAHIYVSFLLCTHLPRFLTKIFFNTLQTWAGKL
jgi:hypothetical protein